MPFVMEAQLDHQPLELAQALDTQGGGVQCKGEDGADALLGDTREGMWPEDRTGGWGLY